MGRQVAWDGRGQPRGQYWVPHPHQDPLAPMEPLLWKQKMLERDLEVQAGKISALEALAHSLHQGGHPEAPSALGRCQAMLLRYWWLWGEGCCGRAGTGI